MQKGLQKEHVKKHVNTCEKACKIMQNMQKVCKKHTEIMQKRHAKISMQKSRQKRAKKRSEKACKMHTKTMHTKRAKKNAK